MPSPSKGERERLTTRVPAAVHAELERRRLAAGVSSESQYLADLLSILTGHKELVVELDQEVLPLTA